MSLENTTAKYTITIVKEGTGATAAAQEFRELQAEAQATSAVLQQSAIGSRELATASVVSNTALKDLKVSSKALTASMHELRAVGALIGMQAFPELTMGAMAVSSSLSAVRAMAVATSAPLLAVGGAVAGVTAMVYAGVAAFDAYKAKQEVSRAHEDLLNQSLEIRKALLTEIAKLQTEGKLSKEKGDALAGILNSTDDAEALNARIVQVGKAIRSIVPSADVERALKEIDKIINSMALDTMTGFERERAEAKLTYEERKAQLADLAIKAKMSPADAATQASQADEWYATKLAQIEGQEQIKKFEEGLTITSLQSSNDRVTIAKNEYDVRVTFYQGLAQVGAITEDQLTEYQNQALVKRLQAVKHEATLHIATIREIEVAAAQDFASGFSNAFVDFVSGTKSAADAFREFAVGFLKQVSEMIIQMEVLKLIKSVAGSYFSEGGVALSAAGGIYPRFAAAGLTGVSSVSSATYFPNFNVVAGEAGREMLTVLARPRMMDIGGMQAVVGQAGPGNTLAITNAADLANRSPGANGHLLIEIQHSDEAKAKIISSSIEGATVRVTQLARQSSPLRSAIKQAAS
jgi:hypothetical protein